MKVDFRKISTRKIALAALLVSMASLLVTLGYNIIVVSNMPANILVFSTTMGLISTSNELNIDSPQFVLEFDVINKGENIAFFRAIGISVKNLNNCEFESYGPELQSGEQFRKLDYEISLSPLENFDNHSLEPGFTLLPKSVQKIYVYPRIKAEGLCVIQLELYSIYNNSLNQNSYINAPTATANIILNANLPDK